LRQNPLDDLAVADAQWRGEGAADGLPLPVDELGKGDLAGAARQIRTCVDAVLASPFVDP
jgi:hypothetical protein